MSRKTAQRWLAEKANRDALAAARGEVVRETIATLRNGLPIAAARLVKIAGECGQDSIAVRAALAVFQAHESVTDQTEMRERLARMEESLAAFASTHRPHRPFNPSRSYGPTLVTDVSPMAAG